MKPLIIFKVGNTFASLRESIGDFEDWIMAGLNCPDYPIQIVDPREPISLPDPQELTAAIITGSHSMVSDREPWSERLAAWLQHAVAQQLPVLGICYGHQLLAHAMGGIVDYHPQGLEIGTVDIELTAAAQQDPLFKHLPFRFAAQTTHRQSVRQLPATAQLLAANTFESHHAFRIGACAWGVQFHPEFSPQAMQVYVEQRTECSTTRSALLSQIQPTIAAHSLLSRFVEFSLQESTDKTG